MTICSPCNGSGNRLREAEGSTLIASKGKERLHKTNKQHQEQQNPGCKAVEPGRKATALGPYGLFKGQDLCQTSG